MEYWCPWDEQWIDPAVAPEHWCPTMDEHEVERCALDG